MSRYFEGWYLKHQNNGMTLALIPGRSKENAFIQVVTDQCAYNIKFPLYAYIEKGLGYIGKNRFSASGIHLDINTNELRLYGEIRYTNLTPISYDIMGPFRFFPMECRHSIVSMYHELSGRLSLNGEIMDFKGGKGYIEGDRGKSFPKNYTWIHCNAFAQKISVTVAIAKIPFAGIQFSGCIAVVWYGGKEYRLATYKGIKIIKNSENSIILTQFPYRLNIEIEKQKGYALSAPKQGAMTRIIHEAPACRAKIGFYVGGKLLFDEVSDYASHEFVP